MAKKYDVVHAEKYMSNGEEKTRWINVGAVLSTQKGGFVLKLDSMPLRTDGWFQLFEPKEREAPKPAPSQPAGDDFDSDIPFAQHERGSIV